MALENTAALAQIGNGLTVRDLIEQLQNCDPDLPVVIGYPYGDRVRTTVASVVEEVEEAQVTWSEYHRTFKVPKDGSTEDDAVEVVVIS